MRSRRGARRRRSSSSRTSSCFSLYFPRKRLFMVATPVSCHGVAQDVLSTSQLAERNWHLPLHMFSDGSEYAPNDAEEPMIEKVAHDACFHYLNGYNLADLVIDISQSVKYIPYNIGAAPCLLPLSKLLHNWKLLSVKSRLSLQGIFAANFPFLRDQHYVEQKGWTGIGY